MKPLIGSRAAALLDRLEARRSILQLDPARQARENLGRHLATHTHRILAFNLRGGMHQPIGQLAVIREEQQTARIDIQSSDSDPFAAFGPRQMLEHGGPSFGILLRHHFAVGLVIKQHLVTTLADTAQSDRLTIDTDRFITLDRRADSGGLTVNRDATGLNPGFDLAPGTVTGLRQELV